MAVYTPHSRRFQPTYSSEPDWGHPSTKGMVFAAVPFGATFYDLVTRVAGERTGGITPFSQPNAGGHSTQQFAQGAYADGVNTTQILWPISATVRGGDLFAAGTILCLGGTTAQVDGTFYMFGGNTEIVTSGVQPALGVDSFISVGRGNVARCSHAGIRNVSTNGLTIGNPFNKKLHFFGYAFDANGANGEFFARGRSEVYTGSSEFNNTTTNRRARIFTNGDNGAAHDAFIALFMMWNRRLTAEEYAALYRNPYQLFKPTQRRLYLNAAEEGGGGDEFQPAWAFRATQGVLGAGVH